LPVRTDIVLGAQVAIEAQGLVGLVDTANARVARIVGARIVVRTVLLGCAGAHSFSTHIRQGARISVRACEPLIGGHKGTLTVRRAAHLHQASRVGTLRRRAGNHAIRVHLAIEGDRINVAHQRAVAKVSIFECQTIFVRFALTRQRGAGAFSALTQVSGGARVTIVARQKHRLERALPGFTALIGGAHVTVVACDWYAGAFAALAVIFFSAGVTIVAFTFGLFVLASGLRVAGALSTRVAVVAGFLVHFPVAVVIKPVALFQWGFCRHTPSVQFPANVGGEVQDYVQSNIRSHIQGHIQNHIRSNILNFLQGQTFTNGVLGVEAHLGQRHFMGYGIRAVRRPQFKGVSAPSRAGAGKGQQRDEAQATRQAT